jgi:hypothetical protein
MYHETPLYGWVNAYGKRPNRQELLAVQGVTKESTGIISAFYEVENITSC